MIKDGLSGDKYLFGVLVYNGERQAPVRWLEGLGYAVLLPIIGFLMVVGLSADLLLKGWL